MMEYGEWKVWNGGTCPVDPETKVQVQLYGESRREAEESDTRYCSYGISFEWAHSPQVGKDNWIVAYREVREPVIKNHRFYIKADNVDLLTGQVFDLGDKDKSLKLDVTSADGVLDWDTARLVFK